MSHVRQQIRDRMVTILTGLPTTGTKVYAMRKYALDDSKLPCLLIYTMDKSSSLITIGSRTLMRNLTVAVETIVKNSDSVQDIVDNICRDVEEAVAADFTLNGLVKSCILTGTEINIVVDADRPISSARLVFTAQYITTIGDVETAR